MKEPYFYCRTCPYLKKNPGYKGHTCLKHKMSLSKAKRKCIDIKRAIKIHRFLSAYKKAFPDEYKKIECQEIVI
jgi:hypothetical protein